MASHRAVHCVKHGEPEDLVITKVEALCAPDDGEVVIDVKACGVNFPDLLQIQGKYQFKPPMPFSPGGEISGVISAVGPDVTDYKIGDRVFVLSGYGGMAT